MSSARVQTSFRKKNSKRTYAPTTAELNEAIEDYLHEHPKASTDQVRASLVKAHETWLIPDRRLNKFVKRQKSGKPMTMDDDTTLASKGPGHRIRGFFTIKGAGDKKSSPKNITIVKESSPTPESAPPKAVVKEEAPPVAKPAVEAKVEELPAVSEDKAAAYVDDNDGKTTGMCAACEGCTIL